MKFMALELDYGNMMVIRFLLFCKREIIFETIFWISGTQNEVPDRAFNSSSYFQSSVILNRT